MRRIELQTGQHVLVDAEDVYSLTAMGRWFWLRNSIRCDGSGHGIPMTSLPRAVLDYYGKDFIRHKDGNPLNNQKSNLEIIPRAQAVAMRKAEKELRESLSQYLGVQKTKSRTEPWKAELIVRGKRRFAGAFANETDAALAYDALALRVLGPETELNFGFLL